MGLLDFIKNRQGQSPAGEQQSQQQKPETAKQMYTREAAQEKANRIAPTAHQEAQAQKIGNEMQKATQPAEEPAPVAASAPDDRGSNAALLQNQNNQDKAQKAMSPTDDAAGKTATQDKPAAPEKPARTPQPTVPRRPPSWER